MTTFPKRILLDTNIFIFGYSEPDGPEAHILSAIEDRTQVDLILSDDLVDQIRRVARRIGGKDWAGLLLNRLWQNFSIMYVEIAEHDKQEAIAIANIPREDIGIYLAAIQGDISCMVSANHEFIRQAATTQKLFECLKPEDFITKYLST